MAPWWMRPTADGEDEESESPLPDQDRPDQDRSNQDRSSHSRSEHGRSENTRSDGRRPSRTDPDPQESDSHEEAASSSRPARENSSQGRRPARRGSAKASETEEESPDDNAQHEEQSSPPRPRRRRRRRSSNRSHAEDDDYTFDDSSFPFEEEDSGEATAEPSLEAILRELFHQAPEKISSDVEEHKIALFCDFENIALGVRDSESKKFEISLVLERLREKGKVIVKKAYSDWSRYGEYKKTFHEAGIELIEIPQKYYSGKNSADIKMVVDAMDLCYSNEHIDTFVVMSGDSDFSPLVSKLKENNKTVIGVGVKNASSSLLIDNCDEFIYYEDLWRDAETAPLLDGLSNKDSEAFGLLNEAILALVREDKDVLWGSMIKQTMKRKRPSFNEGYFGYRTFSELLEDAENKNIIRLKKDRRSGSYIVTGFASARH